MARAATTGLEVGRRRCFPGQKQPLEDKIWIEYEQRLIYHQKPPSLLGRYQDGSEAGHVLHEQRGKHGPRSGRVSEGEMLAPHTAGVQVSPWWVHLLSTLRSCEAAEGVLLLDQHHHSHIRVLYDRSLTQTRHQWLSRQRYMAEQTMHRTHDTTSQMDAAPMPLAYYCATPPAVVLCTVDSTLAQAESSSMCLEQDSIQCQNTYSNWPAETGPAWWSQPGPTPQNLTI